MRVNIPANVHLGKVFRGEGNECVSPLERRAVGQLARSSFKELLCYGVEGSGEAGLARRQYQSFSEQVAGGIVPHLPCW